MSDEVARTDFFISYNKADRAWAEWIAWVLEAEGYTTLIQAWDFRPGMDFIGQMDQAAQRTRRTIAVLSPHYLAAVYTHPEWHTAFRRDVKGEKALLVPVRVRDLGPDFEGLLANLAWIDLVDKDEAMARTILLDGLKEGRVKPDTAPSFPGSAVPYAPTTPRPDPFPGNTPTYWQLPYPRNLFFTGREEVLEQIHTFLAREQRALLTQAITGLGGVGKSQTAIEYAYRYQHEYQAVFWVQAETREALRGDLLNLAALLNLPEREAQEQAVVVAAMRRWLETHDRWLLILDNVEDHEVALEALPTRGQGQVLLTARDPVLGTLAHPLALDVLPEEEGITFLLRRARLPTPPTAAVITAQREQARLIVKELGALPLALDQAGAYMEETRLGLKDYLALYQTHRRDLLRRRGRAAATHADPVATTFALAFEKVTQANKAAVDLLRLSAFLSPEAIPEELFTKGADALPLTLRRAASDPLRWNDAIEVLRRYALVERQPDPKTLSLHRLVQAVLKDALPTATQRRWAEQAVRLVNRAFPGVEFALWERCQRLLPHALVCASHIEEWQVAFPEAAHLLNQAGVYLYQRAQYAEALPLYQLGLRIDEQTLGPDHPEVAASLNNLAALYHTQGQYAEALPRHERALAIWEQALGPTHPFVATSLNNLALLHQTQGQYAEALPLYQLGLRIDEQTLGPDHPDGAARLNNLAELYRAQGQYAEALPLYQHSLAIREQALGPEHPNVATSLNNLAELYQDQGQYAEALPLYQHSLAIREQALGPEHPSVAVSLYNLALLYQDQGSYHEALPLFERVLAIDVQAYGPTHPEVATDLEGLATLLRTMQQPAQAAELEARAQAIRATRR